MPWNTRPRSLREAIASSVFQVVANFLFTSPFYAICNLVAIIGGCPLLTFLLVVADFFDYPYPLIFIAGLRFLDNRFRDANYKVYIRLVYPQDRSTTKCLEIIRLLLQTVVLLWVKPLQRGLILEAIYLKSSSMTFFILVTNYLDNPGVTYITLMSICIIYLHGVTKAEFRGITLVLALTLVTLFFYTPLHHGFMLAANFLVIVNMNYLHVSVEVPPPIRYYSATVYPELLPNISIYWERKVGTDLHRAVSRGDFEITKWLLEIGMDANIQNHIKETALHHASRIGGYDLTMLLLEKGARVDAIDYCGQTPLHNAVRNAHGNCVDILLRNGANVNSQEDEGLSPLHIAVEKRNDNIINMLLHKKPRLDLQDLSKRTPLHYATINGYHEIMTILINAGGDLLDITSLRYTNQGDMYYLQEVFDGIIEYYREEGVDINFADANENTLLHLAAQEGYMNTVRRLVSKGAQLDVYNKTGRSPVHLASLNGYTDIVLYLLDSGAEPYNPRTGYSVFHAAAFRNRIHTMQDIMMIPDENFLDMKWQNLTAEDIASFSGSSDSLWWLRKQSPNLNADNYHLSNLVYEHYLDFWKNEYEKSGSALIDRCKWNDEKGVSLLKMDIEDGQAELHYMDEKGNTMLHLAMESGNVALADMLIEAGALMVALNHKNQTPIDVAQKDSKYKDYITPRIQDTRRDAFLHKMLLGIIAQTASLNVDNSLPENEMVFDSYSMDCEDLDRTAQGMKSEIVKVFSKLISSAAVIEPIGSCGRSLLPLAISTNNTTLLPLLLSAGCPLTTTDSGLGIVQLAWKTPDITTWVAMVVTRTVINQLQSDLDTLMEVTANDPHVMRLLPVLCKSICNLIKELKEERPWEAQFMCEDEENLTPMLMIASQFGATLTAWYVWRAGGSSYERHEILCNHNALEAALLTNSYSTALRLVLDMEANPFIKDPEGKLPIEYFPKSLRLVEMMLGKEYRSLDKKMVKIKDEDEKKVMQKVIILYIVLFLQHEQNQSPKGWESFLHFVLDAHSMISEDDSSQASGHWLESLQEILLDNQAMKGSKESVDHVLIFCLGKLKRLPKKFSFDEEDDNFCSLFHTISSLFPLRDRSLQSTCIKDSRLLGLLKTALKCACEEEMPLFLHLLLSVAKVSSNSVLDDLCKTLPLHHAAKHGRTSAVVYLLQCEANPKLGDYSGILPTEYASVFGHSITADTLTIFMTDSDRRLLSIDLHNSYLKLYGINIATSGIPRYHVQSYDELLANRFDCIENELKQKGVDKIISDVHVDFSDEESQAVKREVGKLLFTLKTKIAQKDTRFEGEIEFVGSSEDNVRLYCPDEYDCNLVLSNITGYPDCELNANLTDLDSQKAVAYGHKRTVEVQVMNEDLKSFIGGREFLTSFYKNAYESLMDMDLSQSKLKLVLPGIKKTQVGTQLFLLWLGKKFPMLFVDVDLVPTVKAPWPEDLPKPKCIKHILPENNAVYLNKIDGGEWRLSFGSKETMIMKGLSDDKRKVFLFCKTILASLKTESWVSNKVKAWFMYWDSRMFTLSAKGGFALKNCFFRELDEVIQDDEWIAEKMLKRACSIFERMCNTDELPEASVTMCPKPVNAYFGGDTEKASVYLCAPEILKFLIKLESVITPPS